MIEIPMRFVPLTTQLISTPDLPNSINAGSTSIDMEASAKKEKVLNIILTRHFVKIFVSYFQHGIRIFYNRDE